MTTQKMIIELMRYLERNEKTITLAESLRIENVIRNLKKQL